MIDPNAFAPFLLGLKCEPRPPGILLSARYEMGALDVVRLPVRLPESLLNARLPRRAEFLAGRCLSHIGETILGRTPSTIGIAPNRAPIWPAGLAGSISHANCHAGVWLAENASVSLGLDIERVLPATDVAVLEDSVLNEREMALLEQDPLNLSIAFSAKESVFKALGPLVGRLFDFSAVNVVAKTATHLTCVLQEDLSESWRAGQTIVTSWREVAPGVQTFVLLPRTPKDRSVPS